MPDAVYFEGLVRRPWVLSHPLPPLPRVECPMDLICVEGWTKPP